MTHDRPSPRADPRRETREQWRNQRGRGHGTRPLLRSLRSRLPYPHNSARRRSASTPSWRWRGRGSERQAARAPRARRRGPARAQLEYFLRDRVRPQKCFLNILDPLESFPAWSLAQINGCTYARSTYFTVSSINRTPPGRPPIANVYIRNFPTRPRFSQFVMGAAGASRRIVVLGVCRNIGRGRSSG